MGTRTSACEGSCLPVVWQEIGEVYLIVSAIGLYEGMGCIERHSTHNIQVGVISPLHFPLLTSSMAIVPDIADLAVSLSSVVVEVVRPGRCRLA